jgi:four helix bundle protein
MKTYFDHERLDVYQEAIAFCGWAGDLLSEVTVKASVKDQLDRASTSIPLNIAEGNGKFSNADRARFLEIARGSALECAACIDVLAVRRLIAAERIMPRKSNLFALLRCSWECSKGFPDARICWVRKSKSMVPIMSRSMSMSTRKTHEINPARS